jgi:dihydroneopterin aldolase/2-amino-4-hydroxy-6-hydroxymethyldihydropteridine diphosphokinase
MDSISIKGLKFYAKHGVLDAEKEMGQFFYLDIIFYLETSLSDDQINKTVHYGNLSTDAVEYCTSHRFDLIETLANNLALHLMIKYPLIQKIDVTLHKPHAPITESFEDVAINIVRERRICYLALGSNLGDRKGYLDNAILQMNESKYIDVKKVSSFIKTAPFGVTDQPDFINAVVKCSTLLTPSLLLEFTQSLEVNAKRNKKRRWGERTLDVDILFLGDIVLFSDDLIIPHSQIQFRSFVLEPMAEIDPFLIHPIFKKNIQTLLIELERTN